MRPVAVSPADTLERLTPGARVRGILAGEAVEVVQARWYGSAAVELTYRRADGHTDQEVLYRLDEARLTVEADATGWALDGDPKLFRYSTSTLLAAFGIALKTP